MKPVVFYIDNNEIQFTVNLMGLETLKVNGTQISKKWSLPNRKHKFTLDAYGKTEHFYIKTKQAFSTGNITVQMFHNDVLIDEDVVAFDFFITNNLKDKSDNGMFSIGLIFVIFGLIFDWSKLFLFIGLIFLFSSFTGNSCETETPKDSKKSD
tara:strand:- start:135 stop:593 length:459 start_codon:yes stop_codon:yes gene_type:complete